MAKHQWAYMNFDSGSGKSNTAKTGIRGRVAKRVIMIVFICIIVIISAILIIGREHPVLVNADPNAEFIEAGVPGDAVVAPLAFMEPKEAIEIMKPRPVGTDPWTVYFSDSEFVYLTYNFGIKFIFRYSIADNTIDRALDTRALFSDPQFDDGMVSANCFFTSDDGIPDGAAYITIGTTSDEPRDLYEVHFDDETVDVAAENLGWDSDFFSTEEMELIEQEEYGVSADAYKRKVQENSLLPPLYDWSTVRKIDDDLFFIISPNDSEKASPGAGYYYFKIRLIDTSTNKVIQEYRFDANE
jgi:hypothetical protein